MWFNSDEKEPVQSCTWNDLLVVEGGAGAGGCAVIEAVDFPCLHSKLYYDRAA